MNKAMQEFWEDLRWGENHHTQLLLRYKDLWVAIQDKEVVSFGSDLSRVKMEARVKTGKEDVPVLFVECGEHIYGQS
jgi:hypothetical protein